MAPRFNSAGGNTTQYINKKYQINMNKNKKMRTSLCDYVISS